MKNKYTLDLLKIHKLKRRSVENILTEMGVNKVLPILKLERRRSPQSDKKLGKSLTLERNAISNMLRYTLYGE